jgi:hypothetical protein
MNDNTDAAFAELLDGFAFGGHERNRPTRDEVAAPVAENDVVEPDWPGNEPAEPDFAPEPEDFAPQSSIVRPYAWTRGRTRSTFELRVETMVSMVAAGGRAADAAAFAESEHRAIGRLCHEPRSVAEVATLMGAPLGVAKVLLGDMAQLGLVTVHKTATGGANRAHLVLMERVLSGLRRL